MRSRKVRALIICAVCAVLVGATLLFALGGGPRTGEYESEYGTRYRITKDEITRLGVLTAFSEDGEEFSVDVVYTYDVYTADFEKRIEMRLSRIEYGGKDQVIKNLVGSVNRDIAAGGAEKYTFAGLSLKARTDGEYARGAGNVRINGELLKRTGRIEATEER